MDNVVKRYRWNRSVAEPPPGIQLGKCYTIERHVDGSATKASEFDLLDEDGRVVMSSVHRKYLEPCDASGAANSTRGNV